MSNLPGQHYAGNLGAPDSQGADTSRLGNTPSLSELGSNIAAISLGNTNRSHSVTVQASTEDDSPTSSVRNEGSSTQPQPDYGQWSSTAHSNWIEDSLISNIYHPPAAGPPSSNRSSTETQESTDSIDDPDIDGILGGIHIPGIRRDVDPMLPSSEGFMGVPDANTLNHRIHLRGASTTTTHYDTALYLLLGSHAVNYLYMHYYSAGSALVVVDALTHFAGNASGFIRYLVRRDMPTRHAAFLWTIIRPQLSLESLGFGGSNPETSDDEIINDDQDMSFTRGP
ncbi:hypothetical protein FRC00_010555 [Tulasnella sp. 408]|nr:hypothetical protein FRC00_010555 [Tulasnella sp. 408]